MQLWCFSIVTNAMISLAFIQFCTIILYHFLNYTCHFNVLIMFQRGKLKMMNYCLKKRECQDSNYLESLDIPDCTYNYTKYRDELISDDFK